VNARRVLAVAGVAAVAAVLVWVLFVALPRWYGPRPSQKTAAAPAAPAPPPSGRKIKARLLYVAADGVKLTAAEQEVPFAEGTVGQAKAIVTAQIAPAAEPLVSAVPQGTALRALFVTDRGEAYVDLSREFATGHTGGTNDERLSVYTIVNVLTVNLPAIKAVQVLVDGKEIDTLAGHVDLRRPLAKNVALIE
jgi:spore germination protein GerM